MKKNIQIKIIDSINDMFKLNKGFVIENFNDINEKIERFQNINYEHYKDLNSALLENEWKPKCNTSHCFYGGRKIYKNGEVIFYISDEDKKEILDNKSNLEKRNLILNELNKKQEEVVYDSSKKYEKILVQGGHYIPNLYNLNKAPVQSLMALEKAILLVNKLKEQGKKTDLMIYINDIRMLKGGKIRKKFYNNFVLPEEFRKLLLENDISPIIISETKLYRKVCRSRKQFLRDNKIIESDRENIYSVKTEKGNIDIIKSFGEGDSQIKCDSACMYLYHLVNEMGYDLLISNYPTCAQKGIEERSYPAYKKLFLEDRIDVINSYSTFTCWANSKGLIINTFLDD